MADCAEVMVLETALMPGRETILVVDDDWGARAALAAELTRAGYAVREAPSAAAADGELGHELDLVVVDLGLGNGEGLELCRRVRQTPSVLSVPIIYVTDAAVPVDERIQALESGVDAYLVRPVDPRELSATAGALLRVRRIQRALRSAARTWQSTFDAMSDGVLVLDADRRVRHCNRALRKALETEGGTPPNGRPVEAAIAPLLGPIELPPLDEVQRGGGRLLRETQWGERHLRLALDVIVDEHGVPTGAVGVITDITETRQLEEELWRRYTQLVEIDGRKDEFLAMLGHELRNPIAAIKTGLEVMASSSFAPQTVGRVSDILDRQVIHLTRLVNDLLEVSRVTRGHIELRRQDLDARDALQDALRAAVSRIESSGHDLELDIGEEPLPIHADPTRIEQVIANLLDNAVKYSPPGRITVKLAREVVGERAWAVLSVRDRGLGIEPAQIEQIFQPFVQLDRTLDRGAGGLGVGLTLVRRLIAMHDGVVEAHSAGRGHGTELVVRIPLAVRPAAATQIDGALVGSATPGVIADDGRVTDPGHPLRETQPEIDRRLLLVEDNPELREMLVTMLSRHGFQVTEAADGISALEAALRDRPPVAILDIGLPKIDGFEVARRIRAEDPRHAIRLVAMTGYGSRADREHALRVGFDAHLVKPVEIDDLVQTLAQVFEMEPANEPDPVAVAEASE